jgi:hypothetical protein
MVREEDVRIQQDYFGSGKCKKQRIGDLAPARVAVAKGPQVGEATELGCFQVVEIMLRVDAPAMVRSGGEVGHELCEDRFICFRIGDQMEMDRFDRVLP